jgi:hypothetical protein
MLAASMFTNMARAWLAGVRTVLVMTQDGSPAESRIELRIERECSLTTDASAVGMNLMLAIVSVSSCKC